MRPASRGTGATGLRPGTGQQLPPGTGIGGGMRPGTGQQRLGTAARMAGSAPGFLGDVAITERPVTQQGMAGVRGTTAGPGRQIQDASYFIGILRGKISEISGEINRMRGELDRGAKDATVMGQLERKYDTLIKEVRGLEGDLADYNLAMDKARTSMDASEIVAYANALKARNGAAARDVDAIFMERTERERGAARLEEQISELTRAAEARINSLPPQQIAEYRALSEENHGLAGAISAMQAELEAVNAQVDAADVEIRRDRVREEYAILAKRALHLRREKAALEEEMSATRLDPAEARAKLLAKVKDDNAAIKDLDAQLRGMEEANAARAKTLDELSAEIEERRGEAGDSSKYEALFRRDAEMTEFIDRFPETRDKELAEQRRLQNGIVALLEHMSEGIEREKNMPSREQADEMKSDLSDKARELAVSQMTAERLQEELQLRQTELEKVSTLDTKIAAELKTLADRSVQMRGEMARFADIAGLKATAEATKAELETKVREYTRRKDLLRQQVHMLHVEVERKKAALAKDPQASALEALEAKLRTYEQSVFTLREFIATKGRETQYEALRDEVMKMYAELNVLLQKAQVAMGATALGGITDALAGTGLSGLGLR